MLSFAGAGVVIFFAVENYINLPSSSSSTPNQNTSLVAPTIITDCGRITGSVTSLPFGLDPVFRYAGIPFGQPPVGDLRLRAPVAATCPWPVNNNIIDGSILPSVCVQADGSGSEDCLYLNVVTPTTATNASQLPVIVYFHGGDLLFGSAVDEIRNIEGLVAQSSQLKQDVIAVTVRHIIELLC
jgi:carboxylesterase type B